MTLCPSTLGANFLKPLAKRLVKIVSAKEVKRAPPVLPSQEERKHAKRSNKETNDRGRLPWIGLPTLLQRQEEHDNR
jgi:hypothetical protein